MITLPRKIVNEKKLLLKKYFESSSLDFDKDFVKKIDYILASHNLTLHFYLKTKIYTKLDVTDLAEILSYDVPLDRIFWLCIFSAQDYDIIWSRIEIEFVDFLSYIETQIPYNTTNKTIIPIYNGDEKITKEQFKDFLEKIGLDCYDNFVANFNVNFANNWYLDSYLFDFLENADVKYINTVDDYFKVFPIEMVMDNAFDWDCFKEKRAYWENVQNTISYYLGNNNY